MDTVGPAKQLSAMQTMGNAGILPMDSTGKALVREGLAASIGDLIAPGAKAVLTGGLASPLVWKKGIETGLAAKAFGQNYSPLLMRELAAKLIKKQQGDDDGEK